MLWVAPVPMSSSAVLFDSHCHFHMRPQQLAGDGPLVKGLTFCPMSVEEKDWAPLLAASKRSDIGVVGLGIHPWFAHRRADSWDARLVSLLKDRPEAIVGEIGLDKVARTPETRKTEWEDQLRVFKTAWEIAVHLERPVSMHCVRAHGFMHDWIRDAERRPPAMIMHSYTGSEDSTKALTRLPGIGQSLFFGFSPAINMKAPNMEAKVRAVLQHVPESQILLESDLEAVENGDALLGSLRKMCELIGEVKGMSPEEVAEMTRRNGERALMRAT